MANFEYRIGQGVDIHPFQSGRRLVLGGVEIASEFGLAGHSDADALLHALTDALLGAVGQGDIGQHFPDSDERWKDCASFVFVEKALRILRAERWSIVNLDCTILAQVPKLSPHYQSMQSNIAQLLGVPNERVSIKATTTERLGFVGRSEGLSASVVVLIERER